MDNNQYARVAVRASAILTNSYVAGSVIGLAVGKRDLVENSNQLIILADFIIGSLTDCLIKVEFGYDIAGDGNITYFQEAFSSISAGVNTMTAGEYKLAATGKFPIPVPLKASFVKISAKGTGTVTSSLLAIDALIGTA